MTTIAAEPRYTLTEIQHMLDTPTKDLAYQRMTRLGPSVVEYLAWKRMSGAAEATLDSYERELARLATRHPALNAEDFDSGTLLAYLLERPEASRRKIRAILSDYWQWATAWKRLPHNPMALLPRIKAKSAALLDVFTADEQAAIAAAARWHRIPHRDTLIVRLLFETGARLADIRELIWRDVNADAVLFRHRKGGKTLAVPVGDDLQAAFLDAWHSPYPARFRREHKRDVNLERTPEPNHFVLYPSGWAQLGDRPGVSWVDPRAPMAKSTVQRWWTELLVGAGVRHRKLHMTRHTVGTELYAATKDLVLVQELLGHDDIKTTRLYVHQDASKLRAAPEALIAWRGRA